MLRTALVQMAAHRGRLAAAGLAVVIGTAFVAATLLASGLMQATLRSAVSASYAGADVVVTTWGAVLDDAVVQRAATADGVLAAEGQRSAFVDLATGSRTDFAFASTAPRTEPLRAATALTDGELPAAPGQVAVAADLAGRLGLQVGDVLEVRWTSFAPVEETSPAGGEPVSATAEVVVTGLLTARQDLTGQAAAVLGDPEDVARWATAEVGSPPPALDRVLVAAAPGADPAAVRESVEGALDARPGAAELSVLTAAQQADRTADEFTGGTQVLTAVFLAFAAVAVFVAGVVVTNTLGVLVAQRRRELALMRCVGATRAQVRSMVLVEAGLLGVVASLAGVVLGTALAQAAALVVSRLDLGFPTPRTVDLAWPAVVVPLVVGTVTTLLAALAPARAATRVAPLAALRPAVAPGLAEPRSLLRLAVVALLVAGGGGLLALGVLLGTTSIPGPASVGLGVLGGATSFVGVLVGAPVLLPPVLRVLGWGASRLGGVPSRLAATNAVRNPRRTAVTASALLIGVTLVTLMTVGTASVQRTIVEELDRQYPVDVVVGGAGALGPDDAVEALAPAVLRALDDLAGSGTVTAPLVLTGSLVDQGGSSPQVTGVDPDAAAGLLREPSALEGLVDGTVLVPSFYPGVVVEGQELVLEGPSGSLTVTARPVDLPHDALLLTPGDLGRLDAAAPPVEAWLDVPEGADEATAVEGVQDAVAAAVGEGPAAPVDGAAVERGDITDALDAVLGVVLGLLGVAVVIALVGVSNTLSLSVIERTRESALLRAMGLTRGQLRRTLAVEGLLLAGVGALVGVVLGTGYGWAGTLTVFGDALDVQLALPWERLGLVVAVALVAGLLASVLPARHAVRTPPAAALGE